MQRAPCPAPQATPLVSRCADRPESLGIEPFFMELISGVEAELSTRSYALTLQVVADQAAELAVYRRWWGERRGRRSPCLRPPRR